MMLLSDVVKRLRLVAPLQLCEKWDNVGLLVESSPEKVVEKVLMANDMTSEVLNEAIQHKCQMIVSYHPFIFSPLKTLTRSNWKERLVLECIQSDISVFSPHTSWDAVSWMNNLTLLQSALGDPVLNVTELIGKVTPVLPPNLSITGSLLLNVFSAESLSNHSEVIFNCLNELNEVSENFSVVRKGSERNTAEVITNYNLSKTCQVKPSLVTEIKASPADLFGCGARASFSESKLREEDALTNIKHYLDLRYVRYCSGAKRNKESLVNSIAVCAGSGSGVLKGLFGKVDLVLTGEMSHHEILDAKYKGTSVVLTEHSNSERKFLNEFKQTLEETKLLPNCEVLISSADKDPLDVF